MRKWAIFIMLVLTNYCLSAQEKKVRKWSLNGYVKDMASYTSALGQESYDNLVHNRLNFKWYPTNQLKFIAELRNRVIIGDQIRNLNYAAGLDMANDYFDLSYAYQDSGYYLFHTMLDRLYLQYAVGKMEVRIGRQRINWGINTVWNPNDIFNAYSYFDFDYEERPGSDAILLRYYTGIASSIEVAGKIADDIQAFTSAALWKVNYKGYDIQVLAGITAMNAVLGGGWAGNIRKAGFKGEGSYFYPLDGAFHKNEAFVGALALDYSFKNSLYVNGSVLYCSERSVNPNALEQLSYFRGNISARNLSPYKWSSFLQLGYQLHPLVNGGLALIGYPGNSDAYVGPVLTISVKQNIDLNLFGQVLFSEVNNTYTAGTQAYYLRLKYSF